MYTIFKNNKRNTRKIYETYEAARQAVRKLIRRNDGRWKALTRGNNPAYTVFGYSIRAV